VGATRLYGVGRLPRGSLRHRRVFRFQSPCAQAFALELQAFSVLPFQQTTDPVEKLHAQKVAFEELIIPAEIHDLLRWSDWVRAYRATAEFFDRKLAASEERH
jgi:hypothetical protein